MTEERLIYTIWDIVRGAESNDDDPMNERLMRAFLMIHRAKLLNQYYKKGIMIPDECFQDLGVLNFTLQSNQWVSGQLPKIIRFSDGHYGLNLDKLGYNIPVLNSEEFYTSKVNRFNKFQPITKFELGKLFLHLGKEQSCNQGLDDSSNTYLNTTVRALNSESKVNTVSLTGKGVLVNPDDDANYDFTTSPYPMPDELIESLVNSVNAREFNLFLRVQSDEKGNKNYSPGEQPQQEI